MSHWLRKEGIEPWNEQEYFLHLKEHEIDGYMLLSLKEEDMLHVLDPKMKQNRPGRLSTTDFTPVMFPRSSRADEFDRNLLRLKTSLGELKEAIAYNPISFWEYRIAHRRNSAFFLVTAVPLRLFLQVDCTI